MKEQYIDYLYSDNEEGECFFVEMPADTASEDLANEIFENATGETLIDNSRYELVGIMSAEDAELLGYDTY